MNSFHNNNSSVFSLFSQAFLIAIENPKAIIFFTALFPQFISKEGTSLSQYTLMTITLGFISMILYAIARDKATNFIKNSFVGRYLNRITGGIFISAGCSLALKN
ncbi:LysE family translocator [Halarcobacter ebronensis]|uniref:LysE family translocator n=1 Tax=Halarcobacter ebronensis TaxID=1462615 RepID=UPI001E2D9CAA|nr:LysE family transporter [Halarcobacter ebronensis]